MHPNETQIYSTVTSGVRLAVSLTLFYAVALSMNWDLPKYGALAIVLIHLDTNGASIRKGMMRILGTTIGISVGWCALACFNGERWALLVAFAVYLWFISYGLQSSRYAYAWFVTGFLPLVIWADNYPGFDSAFYFGTFRWLETAVGVVIYTMVSAILWPRSAGARLPGLVQDFCFQVRKLFEQDSQPGRLELTSRDQIATRRLARQTLDQIKATLPAAVADTVSIRSKATSWQCWIDDADQLLNSMDDWITCHQDAIDAGITDHKEIEVASESIRARLVRLASVCNSMADEFDKTSLEIDSAKISFQLEVDDSSVHRRAVTDCLTKAFERMDAATLSLSDSTRLLVSGQNAPRLPLRTWPAKQSSFHWDSNIAWRSCIPSLSWIAAFAFWVQFDPPTGPAVPMFASILSLIQLLSAANPIMILGVSVASLALFVAPVYWFVMPTLSTGEELLTLVFVFAFSVNLIGSQVPAFKTLPLMMFVMTANVTNQQAYSFNAIIDGSIMMTLAATAVVIVNCLIGTIRPEQVVVRDLRRYLKDFSNALERRADNRPDGSAGAELPDDLAVGVAKLKSLDPIEQNRLQELCFDLGRMATRLRLYEADCVPPSSESDAESTFIAEKKVFLEHMRRFLQKWTRLDPTNFPRVEDFDHLLRNADDRLRSLSAEVDRIPGQFEVIRRLSELRAMIDAMSHVNQSLLQINWPKLRYPGF